MTLELIGKAPWLFLAFALLLLPSLAQEKAPPDNQHLTDDQLLQIELRADLTKCQVVLERQNRIIDALQNELARLRKAIELNTPKPEEKKEPEKEEK